MVEKNKVRLILNNWFVIGYIIILLHHPNPSSQEEGTTGCLVAQDYLTTIFFPLRM